MIDKGKYSSHGALIKRLPNAGLTHWQKPKHAIINPIPSTIPREKNYQFKNRKQDMTIQSSKLHGQYKFQQKIYHKPLSEQLVQPFLYIQRLTKKIKSDKKQYGQLKPFVTSSKIKQSTFSQSQHNKISQSIPSGYASLIEYEQDKKITASKLFKKLFDNNITNIKDVYLIFNRKINLKENPNIFVKEKQFVEFMKELLRDNITEKQIKHFYQLYKTDYKNISQNLNSSKLSKSNRSKVQDKDNKQKEKQTNKNSISQLQIYKKILMFMGQALSIKAFSFNYQKYLKNQAQISNILSQKALKQRYNWVKLYLTIFDQNYSDLKNSMNSIRSYQQSLRQHFKSMFNSYKNPYTQQIMQLQKQLQKPIIKYDKFKKDAINNKIQQLQDQNLSLYNRIKSQYEQFSQKYQNTIVKNHDLFFNKRTICKLILPILTRTQYLNKNQLIRQIQKVQAQKQRYLEILSNIVVEMDNDKKYLGEDRFTLADMVEMVLMKFNKQNNTSKKRQSSMIKNKSNLTINSNKSATANNNQDNLQKQQQQFTIKSMKKLVKQIKKQYLLKNQLFVQDINQFPADLQIPMQILHTCFEMQCTKVITKNQIWSQLLNLIPQPQKKINYHQQTISCNLCLGYLKKYLTKLDENHNIHRNKSKQISLLIQNANLNNLWYYTDIIDKVNKRLDNINNQNNQDHYQYNYEDQQEINDHVNQLQNKNKNVNFGDIADSMIQQENYKYIPHNNQNDNNKQFKQQQNVVVKDIIKSILNPTQNYQKKNNHNNMHKNNSLMNKNKNHPQNNYIPQSLQAIKTLSKSFYTAGDNNNDKKLTTNSFDIRFYQKMREQKPKQDQIYRLGTSVLISNLPQPQQLFQNITDPLKISHYIGKNINQMVLQQQKNLKQIKYNTNVRQGVDNNYFRDKIKLENIPTRYDSDGKSKYSVIFPVGYYEGVMVNNIDNDMNKNQKWFLRPHHVQTLTQNPLSKKDNLINTQYQSKLDKIPLKKRPDQFIIQKNVQRKDTLIQSLQQRIQSLKQNLQHAQRSKNSSKGQGQKVPNAILNNYLTSITDGKQDKDLQIAAYEAVLYDLRRNQRNLVVGYRDIKYKNDGEPEDKWWEKKDSSFNNQLRKDRLLAADSLRENSPHKKFIEKLKNREIY